MIKKTFLFFFILVLFYSAFVYIYPDKGIGTNQWQENQIKVHRFLYGPKADTVIIGTSLSARILPDSIFPIKSCSFSACVVEDGLRLILSQAPPKCVLIETNYFLRPSNGNLINSNLEGFMPNLRKYTPILQEQNSPISLFGYFYMQGALASSSIVDLDRLEKNINNRLHDNYSHRLTNMQIEERLKVLLPLIQQLEKHNTKIIFFEMPINKRLIHTASNDQTREIVHQLFPPQKYTYLPNDTSSYLTNDGEHLNLEEQYRYSHYFRNCLMSLSTKKNKSKNKQYFIRNY